MSLNVCPGLYPIRDCLFKKINKTNISKWHLDTSQSSFSTSKAQFLSQANIHIWESKRKWIQVSKKRILTRQMLLLKASLLCLFSRRKLEFSFFKWNQYKTNKKTWHSTINVKLRVKFWDFSTVVQYDILQYFILNVFLFVFKGTEVRGWFLLVSFVFLGGFF